MGRTSAKIEHTPAPDHSGGCTQPKCLCVSFMLKRGKPGLCKCGHIEEYHMAQDSDSDREDLEESGGEGSGNDHGSSSDDIGQRSDTRKLGKTVVEDDIDNEDDSGEEGGKVENSNLDDTRDSDSTNNDGSDQSSALGKAKAIASIKARYSASPVKPKTRSASAPKARLNQVLQGFSGGQSTKKGGAKVSTSTFQKGKSKKANGQTASVSSKAVPRKPSGPVPSAVRPLGVMYLVTNATNYILEEDENGVPAGFSRMTRKQFSRETLAANGLKVMSHQRSLETNINWSMDEFNDFVMEIWPPIWAWVKTHLPKGHRGYMWTLMIPTLQELHQSQCSEATLDMHYVWGIAYKAGKAFREGEIWLATVINVPEHIVKQLLGAAGPPALLIPTGTTDSENESSNEDVALERHTSAKLKSSKKPTTKTLEDRSISPKKVKQEKTVQSSKLMINAPALGGTQSGSLSAMSRALPKRGRERTPSVSEIPEPKRKKAQPETPPRTATSVVQLPERTPSVIHVDSSSSAPASPTSPSTEISPLAPASPIGLENNPWVTAPDAQIWLNF